MKTILGGGGSTAVFERFYWTKIDSDALKISI